MRRRHVLLNVAMLLPLLAATFVSCVFSPSQQESNASGSFYQPVCSASADGNSASESHDGTTGVLLETPRMEVKTNELIVRHEGFAISYNQSRCIPNWVAYELTKSETYGDVERTDYFDVDPSVSGRQAKFGDYSHTGYDRGHMAPAGDMKWSKEAMDACFYLTNICPQNHVLNKGDWNDLEIKCREWARRYGKAWIVTGPVVTSSVPKTIGSHHVVVPDAFFKAVMVPRGDSYEAVAFVMDNCDEHNDMMDCSMCIDDLENLAGIDFFYALPDNLEDKVEKKVTPSIWR